MPVVVIHIGIVDVDHRGVGTIRLARHLGNASERIVPIDIRKSQLRRFNQVHIRIVIVAVVLVAAIIV